MIIFHSSTGTNTALKFNVKFGIFRSNGDFPMTRDPLPPSSPFAVVVNDDSTQLNVLSGLVRKAGLEPRAFTAAEAALADMTAGAGTADRDPGALPALVVTDLYMPGIDGWRFCRLLRSPEYAAFNTVPILVVSATFAGDEANRIAADLGAEAFLPSPVDGKRFVELVRAILSGKRVRNPLRVLIVEDSKTHSDLIRKTFEAHSYQTDTALTARAAADAFAQAAYDVAVLNYHLPDGTGDTLLDAFCHGRPDCVCIMMTTDPGPELALGWMRKGAAAYLRKPFEPEYLIELCARAQRERALLRVQDLLEVRTRELQESEERYQRITEAITDYIYTVRVTDGRAVETTHGAGCIAVTGYRAKEFSEDPFLWIRMVAVEDRFGVEEQARRILSGEDAPPIEHRIVHKNGTVRWVRNTFVAHRDKHGVLSSYDGLIQDITERKQMEAALRESEQRLTLAIDGTGAGLWDWDMVKDQVVYSAQWKRMLGYEVHEVEDTFSGWKNLWHPDDCTTIKKTIRDYLAGKTDRYEIIHRCRHKDGSWRWILTRGEIVKDAQGKPCRWVGTNLDITVQKQEEENNKRQSGLISSLLDSIPDIIFFKDLNGVYLGCNPPFAEFVGKPWREIVGRTDYDIFDKKIADFYRDYDQHMLELREPRHNEEWITYPDGRKMLIDTLKTPYWGPDGTLIGVLGISRDITARKQAEAELQTANSSLTARLDELKQHNDEVGLLSEMGSLLQVCATDEEAYQIIRRQLILLFPSEAGALYIVQPSPNIVESCLHWGLESLDGEVFALEDCWALRRGRTHLATASDNVFCSHIAPPAPNASLCVPLMAQSGILGVLHLRGRAGEFIHAKQHLARTVADTIALALANLTLRETLRQQSIRDPLTGLFNRRYMEETLARELARVTRTQHSLGIIMLDIDHFKHFNDTYGHTAGDTVLRELGGLLQANVRKEDIACRYGGEEFLLILPGTSLDMALQRAEQLRKKATEMRLVNEGQGLERMTLSAGGAIFPVHGTSADILIRSADAALYAAKQEGRNRVCVASSSTSLT
jgi:diguanylate cyclase (GGDEF)-like protein/PAS domain S-box-containing protein